MDCPFALIDVKMHFYESVQQPNVKFAGASFATVLIPGTRYKVQLQNPAEVIWLCLPSGTLCIMMESALLLRKRA